MVNLAVIVGRVAVEPELKKLQKSSDSIVTAKVGVERKRKSADGTKKVDYINVTFRDVQADFFYRHFHKGDWVAVVGSIEINTSTNNRGYTTYITEVMAEKVSFCGARTYDGYSDFSEISM